MSCCANRGFRTALNARLGGKTLMFLQPGDNSCLHMFKLLDDKGDDNRDGSGFLV
ncbi:hypothetical protein D623_10030565 [Myotis brandtii]|uniref:Uncharacterized protein n=1 Tax=Myotis brandtii TaxID=109478 RepID=S7MBU4_MYOBR|nr:hypothetical protein D623_10030565 [Myotis brandtii]